MSDQPGSYPFQVLFESALKDYENKTGIPLANHPLAEQLQNCQSVESVTAVLHEQARAFSKFRGSDKIMKSLNSVVSVLSTISATAALGLDIAMVCSWIPIGYYTTHFLTPIRQSISPADAIHTGLAVLLAVCVSFVSTCVFLSHSSMSGIQGRQFRL